MERWQRSAVVDQWNTFRSRNVATDMVDSHEPRSPRRKSFRGKLQHRWTASEQVRWQVAEAVP